MCRAAPAGRSRRGAVGWWSAHDRQSPALNRRRRVDFPRAAVFCRRCTGRIRRRESDLRYPRPATGEGLKPARRLSSAERPERRGMDGNESERPPLERELLAGLRVTPDGNGILWSDVETDVSSDSDAEAFYWRDMIQVIFM